VKQARNDQAAGGLFAGLSRNVFDLGLVSFFADVSSEMLYPLIPVFLTSVLGAPVAVVGLIEGLAEATASLLKSFSGWWSDRLRYRKPFIVGGYSLSALAKPLLGVAVGWPMALGARVLDRVGKGVRDAPRDSLLADSTDPRFRGKAFGWHRGMDTLGAVVGPLLALGLLSVLHGNLRLVLLLAFIPGAIAAALVLVVKDKRREPGRGDLPRLSDLTRPYKAYLLAWGAFAIANSSDVFLILRARSLGFTTVTVVLVYALYNLVYAFASPALGHLSDRIGRRVVLRVGLVVFAVVYLGFALADQGWMMWPLFGVYGLYIAATEGVGKALAIDLVPSSVRGSAVGMFGTVTGLCALVASVVAGVMWDAIGSYAPFLFGAAGAVVAAGLLAFVRQPTRETIANG
jgi:MFS family permease